MKKYRNYHNLDIKFNTGLILLEGDNGQGKSNLLEAIYLLAIGKSFRTSSDRDLIHKDFISQEAFTSIEATIKRDHDWVQLQVNISSQSNSPGSLASRSTSLRTDNESYKLHVQKYILINGIKSHTSELVGKLKAVLFSAEDLNLVFGPPSIRRRYIDILLSQLDPKYLRCLQRYTRIITQRNHLLKNIRERNSDPIELNFWDDQLLEEGKYIIYQRLNTIGELCRLSAPIHKKLAGENESISLLYEPNIDVREVTTEDTIVRHFSQALKDRRQREIYQGNTISGPHRDNIRLMIDGADAVSHASRGQSRTLVVSMKMAESEYLSKHHQQKPVLLLDDIFSELDSARKSHILERIRDYEQCFITTTEASDLDTKSLSSISKYVIDSGVITLQ